MEGESKRRRAFVFFLSSLFLCNSPCTQVLGCFAKYTSRAGLPPSTSLSLSLLFVRVFSLSLLFLHPQNPSAFFDFLLLLFDRRICRFVYLYMHVKWGPVSFPLLFLSQWSNHVKVLLLFNSPLCLLSLLSISFFFFFFFFFLFGFSLWLVGLAWCLLFREKDTICHQYVRTLNSCPSLDKGGYIQTQTKERA